MPRTMTIRLFQAKLKDCPYAFRNFKAAEKSGGVDPTHYAPVYETKRQVAPFMPDENMLENLFMEFNKDDRPGYDTFRSMSISDIVEITDDAKPEARVWYCDTVGFKQIDVKMPPSNGKKG